MSTYCSVDTSWRIRSIGNSGARSSGPTGCPVPGCSTGGGGVGRSCSTLYQRVGISLSSSWNLCCCTWDMAPPGLATTGRSETSDTEPSTPSGRQKGREFHSLPLLTYSAPRGLRQDPVRGAESPSTYGNGGVSECACCCRRTGRGGTSSRWWRSRCSCARSARRCGCARRRTRSSWSCWPGRRAAGAVRPAVAFVGAAVDGGGADPARGRLHRRAVRHGRRGRRGL